LFTLLTVAGWADRFYAPDKYLRTEIYLTVYCAMFVAIAWSCRRIANAFSEFAAWFLWTAPIAYYFASQVVLAGHPIALLVWLMGVGITAAVIGGVAGAGYGFLIWLAAALPLLAWAARPKGAAWLTEG